MNQDTVKRYETWNKRSIVSKGHFVKVIVAALGSTVTIIAGLEKLEIPALKVGQLVVLFGFIISSLILLSSWALSKWKAKRILKKIHP